MQNTRSILLSDEFFCTFNLKMFFFYNNFGHSKNTLLKS